MKTFHTYCDECNDDITNGEGNWELLVYDSFGTVVIRRDFCATDHQKYVTFLTDAATEVEKILLYKRG